MRGAINGILRRRRPPRCGPGPKCWQAGRRSYKHARLDLCTFEAMHHLTASRAALLRKFPHERHGAFTRARLAAVIGVRA